MPWKIERNFKPNLLCVVPPYGNKAPAGSAYLLGYLKAHGCDDFDFLDLRVGAADVDWPTYSTTGVFGESYVLDIPDLPLVLSTLSAFDRGEPLVPPRDDLFDRFCRERGISPRYLHSYVAGLDRYLGAIFEQIPRLDFVGFSTWTPNFYATLLAAAHLKRRRIPPVIVAGGPQVTASHASAALGLMSGLFDVVALGEGEATLLQLFEDYKKSNEVPRGVPGTKYRDSATGRIVEEERALLRLKELPLPSFAEMPIHAYQGEAGFRTLPFQYSRGCTDKCTFCSEWVFWRHYRIDEPDHAVGQLKELKRVYGVNFIEFTDSLLNGSPKRLVALAERMVTESLDLGWVSFMRAQMDAEMAQLLARAGCNGVFVGIESFSNETLDLMNKRMTENQSVVALTNFLEAGINVTAGFIPGFPGDKRESFLHSVAVVKKLQDRYPGRLELHEEPFTLLPNSPLFENLDQMGLVPQLWSGDFLDIAPAYREVTAKILCSIEGDNQGLERLGRMRIVATVQNDRVINSAYMDRQEEALSLQAFEFEHLLGGWHLARKRTNLGHTYALLVDERECSELTELHERFYSLEELGRRSVVITLDRIEREHLVAPSRRTPRVVRHLCPRASRREGATYTVSPFVVARQLDWRQGRKILIADFVNEQYFSCSPNDVDLLRLVFEKPTTEFQLLRRAERRGLTGRSLDRLSSLLEDLLTRGSMVICDVSKTQGSRSTPRASVRTALRMAPEVARSPAAAPDEPSPRSTPTLELLVSGPLPTRIRQTPCS